MTKEEKRTLFCKLLAARPYGDAAAKLAKWCGGSASTVYKWQEPGGAWPKEEKEARMWAFFGYTMNERGDPVLLPSEAATDAGLVTVSESPPQPVTVHPKRRKSDRENPPSPSQERREELQRLEHLTEMVFAGNKQIAEIRKSLIQLQKEVRNRK
jgi:hypothetical protein